MTDYSIKAATSDLVKDSLNYLSGSASSAALTLISITYAVSIMGLDGYGEAVAALAFYTAVFFVCNFEPWQAVIKFNSNLTSGVDIRVIKLSALVEVFAAVLTFTLGYLAVSISSEMKMFFLSEGNKDSLLLVFCISPLFMKGTALGILRVYRKVIDINLIIFTASLSRLAMLLLFFDGSAESLFVFWVLAYLIHSVFLNLRALWLVYSDQANFDSNTVESSQVTLRSLSIFSLKMWFIGRAKGAFTNFGVLVLSQITGPTNVALFSLYQRGLGFVTKFTGSFIRALYPIQNELRERDARSFLSFTNQGIGRLDHVFKISGSFTALFITVVCLALPQLFDNIYFFIAVVGVCTAQIFIWMSPYQTTLINLDFETELSIFFGFHSIFSLMALYISAYYFDVQGAVIAHMTVFLIIALWMRFRTRSGLKELTSREGV